MCSAKRHHCYQGDRIPLFAIVHQRVRDRTDEAHVDSEAEATVLILCVVSIERRWLARALLSLSSSASRGFVIVGILSRLRESAFHRLRSSVGFQNDNMTALVSENTTDSKPVRSRCACTEVRLYTVQLSWQNLSHYDHSSKPF